MGFKPHLLATSATLAAMIGASAHAQTAGNTIAELVVTAEKREQSLQDIPVAISAFTSEQRDVIGIQSIQDMTNFTPGLQYSSSTDRVSLRGLGRLTNVLSADASVANYADGVYETFAVRAGSSTLFLDRVEVLRGPQGTLYGRNSIAGAINILSRRPTEEPYAEVRATYGNYNRAIVEGAISGPLGDRVQARLAANWEYQGKGWIKNTVPGMPSEGNVLDSFYVEGQIQVQFSERVEMWTKIGFTNWRHGAGGPGSQSGGWSPYIYDASGNILPPVSATNRNGGNGWDITEFYNASTHFNPGFGCSGLATNVVTAGPNPCVNASSESPWLINRPISYDVRVPNAYTVASHWTYHADDFDIRYIVGGVRYWYHLTGPTPNGSRNPPVTQYTVGATTVYPQESFEYEERNGFISQELNLVSTKEGPLQWIVGGYYYHQEYKQPVSTRQDPRQVQYSIAPPFGVCLSGTSSGNGVPASAVACPPGIGRRFDNRPEVKNTSYAVYGQATYETGDFTFTGGLRYSHDRKYGKESARLLCFGLPSCLSGLPPEFFAAPLDLTGVTTVVAGGTGTPIDPVPQGVDGATVYDPATGFATRRYDTDWSAVTGTAKVEWAPDDDTLAYLGYSKGYRSGGFNIGIFTVLSFLPYSEKETVDAFEFGVKKNWSPSFQTNVALYHYDYKDLQVPIQTIRSGPFMGGTLAQAETNFYNVPKSRSRGFELEALWQPIENLQLIANYSYIDAEIREGQAVDVVDPTAVQPGASPLRTLAQCQAGGIQNDCFVDDPTAGLPNNGFKRLQDLKGGKLPNAPAHKIALAANYTWDFDPGALTLSVSYAWRDKTYGTVFKRWYYEAPSWDQVDARMLWRDADGRYEVIGFVKNIFDDVGYDQGATAERLSGSFSNVYGGSPAGLTCSPNPTFATNPAAGNVGMVNCVQGIRKTFYVTPPRTYGLEVRYKFW
ncbi:MAG: TonB-dependent receptor [Phenylobacterium sp.]|nr:TonB-dependent receptor [Phenylobacterium sp.]